MPGLEPVGYSFEYSSFVILLFYFHMHLWILHSIHFVGSSLIFPNWSLSGISRHFPIHLELSIITTPLPVSYFKTIIILLFVRLAIICWCLYGTSILLYLWHTFWSLLFNCTIHFQGCAKYLIKCFDKTI